jgi:transcriptional regulator with XRE-family HTH domain
MKTLTDKVQINPKLIKAKKDSMGRALKSMRHAVMNSKGKRIAVWEIVELTGMSASTIANAERGRFTVDNYMSLLAVYGNESLLDIFDLMREDMLDTLSKQGYEKLIEMKDGLNTTEFLNAIKIDADRELRITHRAFLDLSQLLPTRYSISRSENNYYATSLHFAFNDKRKLPEAWLKPKIESIEELESRQAESQFLRMAFEKLTS